MSNVVEATAKHIFDFTGVTVVSYHANIGEGLPKHEHIYKHTTQCHAGSIRVTKEIGSWVLDKNTKPFLLRNNEWHEIEALEDGTVFENIFKEGV